MSLAFVAAVGACAIWPRDDPAARVTWENFRRIDKGTDYHGRQWKGSSRAEVEEILGPPGDYTTRPAGGDDPYPTVTARSDQRGRPMTLVFWTVDTLELYIVFDHTGHACFAHGRERHPDQLDALPALIWRVKRQWRRWFPEG